MKNQGYRDLLFWFERKDTHIERKRERERREESETRTPATIISWKPEKAHWDFYKNLISVWMSFSLLGPVKCVNIEHLNADYSHYYNGICIITKANRGSYHRAFTLQMTVCVFAFHWEAHELFYKTADWWRLVARNKTRVSSKYCEIIIIIAHFLMTVRLLIANCSPQSLASSVKWQITGFSSFAFPSLPFLKKKPRWCILSQHVGLCSAF